MPPRPWRTKTSREVYRNRWMSVREDVAVMPDGRETIYGVITTGECVGVLPFLDRDTVVMTEQYRYVSKRVTLEMPTGAMAPGESREAAANRELAEETGYRAGRLTYLTTFHSNKSIMDETCHLFIGEELVPATAPPDETEFIEVRTLPFDEVLRMVTAGEITDAMTVIAVLAAARRLGR
ncbi:MAG TPA: NUDIX hydrolase [Thermodesulfobacteriota bacterium]